MITRIEATDNSQFAGMSGFWYVQYQADELPLSCIGFLSITSKKKRKRRAGDVNAPPAVRNRVASGTTESHQCGTGRLTSTVRLA